MHRTAQRNTRTLLTLNVVQITLEITTVSADPHVTPTNLTPEISLNSLGQNGKTSSDIGSFIQLFSGP